MDTTDAQPEDDSGAQNPETLTAKVIGLDEAEENLIFSAADQRFSVPVDGELRRLVRRARSTPVATPVPAAAEDEVAPAVTALTPREIQARIRAGESPEDIAAASDTDLDAILRYESPIVAERNYVIEQAQAAPIAREPEAPLLGEITVDRLAARGVAAADIEWTAYRIPGAQWTVEMRFTAGERDRSATWSFEPRSRLVSALDDEARWLTETEEPRDEPIPSRLTPVRDWVYDVDTDGGVIGSGEAPPAPEPAAEEPEVDGVMARQQDLLDELSSRRGRRQPILGEDDEDPFDLLGEIPAAHPPASRPDLAVDAEILQLPEAAAQGLSDADAAAIADEIADVEAQPAESESGDRAARKGSRKRRDAQNNADAAQPESKTGGVKDGSAKDGESKADGAEADDNADEKPKPARRSARRASVPSWDEIVFGARTD